MFSEDQDLMELYQQVILDHSRNPRNFRTMPAANHDAEGFNPLCGDHIHIYLDLEDDAIRDISFQGSGCAICTASASIMTQNLKGQKVVDAQQTFSIFHKLLTEDDANSPEEMGKLSVFAGVRKYPVRVKCATLPWHTLIAGLEGSQEPVTTE